MFHLNVMKTQSFWTWSLGLAVATLPFAGGCDQELANSAPALANSAVPIFTNQLLETSADMADSAGTADPSDTNVVAPEASGTTASSDQSLESAQVKLVSDPQQPPANAPISPASAGVVKLAQAGVDESVMLAYVTNSSTIFNLSSDGIVYLNDIGVPGAVITAMLQHDEQLKGSYASFSNSPTYTDTNTVAETTQAPPPPAQVDNGAPPQNVNVTYTYFYDSLAPYGSWIDVAGYGLCWRPTVVVASPAWQPYCDGGHWMYTDSGWYWYSNYSWGWAPFHYGRWFRHSRWGWCWAPDTIWSPAWVSWRYTGNYCGWAPLPPSACYRPGFGFTYFGRSVGFSFSFGLAPSCYTFVTLNHFHNRHLRSYCLPEHEVRGFWNHTVAENRYVHRGGTIINPGIPANRVAAATHAQIRPVHLSDARHLNETRVEHIQSNGNRSLAVFRPSLPAPTRSSARVGVSVPAATRADRNRMAIAERTPSPAVRTGLPISSPHYSRSVTSPASSRPPTASPARNEVQPRKTLPSSNNESRSPVIPQRSAPTRGTTIQRNSTPSPSTPSQRESTPRGSGDQRNNRPATPAPRTTPSRQSGVTTPQPFHYTRIITRPSPSPAVNQSPQLSAYARGQAQNSAIRTQPSQRQSLQAPGQNTISREIPRVNRPGPYQLPSASGFTNHSVSVSADFSTASPATTGLSAGSCAIGSRLFSACPVSPGALRSRSSVCARSSTDALALGSRTTRAGSVTASDPDGEPFTRRALARRQGLQSFFDSLS